MKYYVSFQQMGDQGRPIDYATQSDHETDQAVTIPSVGDYVEIVSVDGKGNSYSGKVISRLFRYMSDSDGNQTCGVNVVVKDAPNADWRALIKE